MSATADKARYFLEQSVPELKELERNKIFTPDEISSVAKKRSNFEHKINARGSSPRDYAQYAEFEINVDALRRKRVKRLGVKSTAHNGQRRIYFVFDRGTRKFPGDVGLWMQSIDYARKQKAYKKLTQLFTSVLRLHPTKPELWIYAARTVMDEHADMTEARSHMQRGLRFCKNSREIWLEYMRLELAYMAKIHARRQILGIGLSAKDFGAEEEQADDEQFVRLPPVIEEDIDARSGTAAEVDPIVTESLVYNSAKVGAVPQAIFDAAMINFDFEGSVAKDLFETAANFSYLPGVSEVLDHIVESLLSNASGKWQVQACNISRPLIGLSSNQPEYPSALRDSLKRIQEGRSKVLLQSELVKWCRDWLQQQIGDDMDPAVRKVIINQIRGLPA